MKAKRASGGGLFKRIFGTYAQVVLVFLAFTIMVVLSCIFMIKMEMQHLRKEAKTTIFHAQTDIAFNVQKLETTLGNIAEIVRVMTSSGESVETVKKYIKDVFNAELYVDAEASGKIIGYELHYDNKLDSAIITYTHRILDSLGNQLGVVCLDANFDEVLEKHAIDMQITEDGYGMLLDKELKIIAHPSRKFLGESLQNSNVPLSIFEDELMHGQDIFERKFVNYEGRKMVIFFKRMENGWYIGAAAPEKNYYQNVLKIAEILSVIAFALALLLGLVLIRIIKMKEKAEIQAKNANRTKSVFLARMSHEIRTPMNAIMGITEIELQKETIDSSVKAAFAMIYNSSNLLLGIINNILDLSKIEAGKMEIIKARYGLASLINDVIQLNVMQNSKRVEFEVHVDEHLPAQLFGDEIRIRQILNNLLSNAFKYTKQGRVNFSISFENGTDASEVIVIFGVSDTGEGMTKKQVNKLFDEYTRFNLETNRYIQGSGLGLNIAQHLLQMMNGHISVESEIGKGTTFVVHLPQKKADLASIGSELAGMLMQLRLLDITKTRSTQFVYERMPEGKVLVVDDVESNLYVARGLMMPYGLSIDVASSGFDAIKKIEGGNVYDVIFMDQMMPGIDGIETTKRLHNMGYMQPIVALTADVLVGQSKRFLENGFDDFLSKPIDVRQLNNVLNKFVRKNTFTEIADNEIKPELLLLSITDAKSVLPIFEFTLENIEDISDNDLHLFTIKAHAIKSVFANIGETALSQMAYALEIAGKAQDKNAIKQKAQGLIDSVKEFIEKTEAKVGKKTAVKDEDPVYLREQMKIIRSACKTYDIDTIKTAMNNLKKMSWSKETEDTLSKISKHFLHSEFDEAAEIARVVCE